MSIVSGIAIYFVFWWTVLFLILPLGVKTQVEENDVISGTAPSAPVAPRMLRKAGQTTILSAVVFAVFYLATQVYGLGPDSFPHIIPGT